MNFFDKVVDAGTALVVAGTVTKKPYIITAGECIDVTATTFKLIVSDKSYQPYEVYNEYAPFWLKITEAR